MRRPVYYFKRVVGYTEGSTYYLVVDSSSLVDGGYFLPDAVIDELVDRGVETLVLQEPGRRLVSTLDDWQDFGREHPRGTVLPISYMGVN